MASADPYTLIFSRPSPLRGVYDSNNNFVTCKDASVSLKDKLNLDTQRGGKTWHYYAQQLFGCLLYTSRPVKPEKPSQSPS